MKKNKKISNEFFINKYMIVYIYITSILAYFILNFILHNQKINVILMFRIYYIILSIVLFVLLKQVRTFYDQYISRIIIIFFSLMIFISAIVIIVNINEKSHLINLMKYIDLSKESILLIETFVSYSLSEYNFKKRELKKASYSIVILIVVSILFTNYYNINISIVKIIYSIIETILFVKIILNTKKTLNSSAQGLYIVKIYVFSTLLIAMSNIYGVYNSHQNITNTLIEIIHLINFRMAWNFIIIQFVREPYKTLSNSLNEKNEQLDELNSEILIKNRELEKSINLLKSKEYLYSTFFSFMPHPIIILNAENNRILFVNKQFLKIAGISKRREIINKRIDKYIEFMPEALENKDYNAIFNIGDKRKFIEAKVLSIYDDSTRKLILIKDNTQIVQIEEIRKDVENKKIEESIRTEFLSSISHDLKTPINVIYSAMQVEKIYIKKGDLEVLKKYNNISKQNCIALIKLTNNLIDNSRINSDYLTPRLENVNVVEVIEDNVMSLVDYVKWNSVDLIFDTNAEECYLNIDREFMDRIILNLVSNAVKFTPHNGKICVIIIEKIETVDILVKDTGSGIEQEFIDKAFNRYSVDGNFGPDWRNGTGIGLCVVKELVEVQGGKIEIKRNEDIGTTISMEFKKEITHV